MSLCVCVSVCQSVCLCKCACACVCVCAWCKTLSLSLYLYLASFCFSRMPYQIMWLLKAESSVCSKSRQDILAESGAKTGQALSRLPLCENGVHEAPAPSTRSLHPCRSPVGKGHMRRCVVQYAVETKESLGPRQCNTSPNLKEAQTRTFHKVATCTSMNIS